MRAYLLTRRTVRLLLIGPIVRIGPNELSINHPSFHYQMFKAGTAYRKDAYHYDLFCLPKATIGIRDPNEIRLRRKALKPLFDRRAVVDYAPQIAKKMDRLVELLSYKSAGLNDVFGCFTLDTITELTVSKDFQAIESPQFRHCYLDVIHSSIESSWIMKLLPNVRKLAILLEPVLRMVSAQAPTMHFLSVRNLNLF